MTESLPLFPLSTVLFPGRVLPLHVFEERYRLLVRELVDRPGDTGARFGVVAIRSGHEVGPGQPDLYNVGCAAELRRVEPYDDGRFDLVTTGGARFALREVDTSRPYLVGRVERLPEDVGDEPAAVALVPRVRAGFTAYLHALASARGSEPNASLVPGLPDDPIALSYVVAAAVLVDLRYKQQLLAAVDGAERLRLLATVLSQETRLLRTFAAPPAHDLATQVFSVN